jgi:hypothetical protein
MKKAFIYILFFLIVQATAAQDIELTIDHPSVVSAGQSFSVVYNVNAGGGEFTVPSFTGFSKLMGPQTSYSQSTQVVNGKISRQTSYSYTYYLQALKTGNFVIAPAVFTLKNREYKSDSLRIEVVSDASQAGNGKEGSNSQASGSGDLFVNMLLNRRDVYVGEPVMATVKLFTKVDLQGINEIKYPSFNNFLRTDIDTPPLTSLQEENVNGSIYGTGIVQKFLLYPQVPGEVIIDPVQITVLVQQRSGSSDPFFGDFFSSYQTVPKTIASKPMTVRVKPLPGSKPDDFSGIVGNLDIKASLGSDSVNVNEALNLKITINGSGNLRIASAPKLMLPPDLEVYDPKITDNLKSGSSGTQGSKSFEYLIIPRHHGSFTIPPVTYSFFNTNTGRFETLSTEEFTFHAKRSDDQASGVTVFSGISKEDVKYLSKDIRFIKSTTEKFETAGRVLTSSRSFYSIYGISFLAFMIILFVRREHVRRNSDLSIVRNRKAGKVAGRRLHTAEGCLKNNQIDRFYEEILKALWGYLSDKLNIPMSELTRVNAISALSLRGVDDELTATLNSILDTCEYARFAPSASGTEAENIYEGASKFIRSVENTIR